MADAMPAGSPTGTGCPKKGYDMKTWKITRTRCECDFCGKRNWSPARMVKHEKRYMFKAELRGCL